MKFIKYFRTTYIAAIDFQKISDHKRHVVEVELGNVASIYRSIHKLILAMEEAEDTVGILIVPHRDLMARCEPPSAMSNSHAAPIILSEFSYYFPQAKQISVIEFSTSSELNLYNLKSKPKFWKGNFSNEMKSFLEDNFLLFIEHGYDAIEFAEKCGYSVSINITEYMTNQGELAPGELGVLELDQDLYPIKCHFIEDLGVYLTDTGVKTLGHFSETHITLEIKRLWEIELISRGA